MGSFYGMGGSGGSGSNLNNDYNNVKNAPIVNVGTTTLGNFVVLSGLEEKHYNVTGYYKVDSNDEVHLTQSPLDVLIYKDSETGNKVVQYFTAENGIVYLNTHIYDDEGKIVQDDKIDLTTKSQKWSEF